MTRYHGATKTCRYSYDGSVSGSASAGPLAHEGADGTNNAPNCQARKHCLRGVLSTLIPQSPGRRLTAMNAYPKAQPEEPLSTDTDQHSSPLVEVNHVIGRREPGSGGSRPVRGRKATAGMQDRGDG
jgi:hypothetical protein